MPERLYLKLWISWYTCESHADLGADALHIGPVLMTFCIRRWVPGTDLAWAVNEKDRPVSTMAIAARAKWTAKRTAAALGELESAGTCVLRSDGAWGFTNFGRWQESADAARKRRVRGQSEDTGRTTDGNPPAIVERSEDQNSSSSGRPPAAKRDSKPPDPHSEATTVVLRALNDARCSVTPGLTPLRKREHIRARLAEGATAEQLLAVIAFAADECRRDPAKLQWLDAVTPFRPKNWESRLARAQAWQAMSPRQGQRFDATPDQLHRERQERLAAIAAEESA